MRPGDDDVIKLLEKLSGVESANRKYRGSGGVAVILYPINHTLFYARLPMGL